MKAAIFTSKHCIVQKDIPLPVMNKNELLVKVQTCGICSSDIRTYTYGNGNMMFPVIPGHEITGEIVDTTLDDNTYVLGQRIVVTPTIGCGECTFCKTGNQHHCANKKKFAIDYNGGFTEYVKIPAPAIKNGNINIIPHNLDYLSASLTEPLACVLNGQENLNIHPGSTVAVIGAGPIGLLHAETARLYGADKIILINRSSQRLLMAKKFNYDAYIDLSDTDSLNILNNCAQQSIDVIIVTVASESAIQLALQLAAPLAKICLFSGMPKNCSQISIDLNLIHYKQLALYGATSSAPRHNQLALKLLADKKIKSNDIISHLGSLEKLKECFDFAQTHKGLKILVTPNIQDLHEDLNFFPGLQFIN